MSDLFAGGAKTETYDAGQIEVLEGLEPVRHRPGMYIGGTDERALHHLVAEILDNAMDEAVAGHASWIELVLTEDGSVTIKDNGRGIPVDEHPKFPGVSALQVILTTLHSGGKFSGKAYATSGGLHGVGLSVVNALSDALLIEVARDRRLWRQTYQRGVPDAPLAEVGAAPNRRGTAVTFHPDPQIFGTQARFRPARLYQMARSKAYLHRGVEIRWRCEMALGEGDATPLEATLHFPGGLADFLDASLEGRPLIIPHRFAGQAQFADEQGRVEWAIAWPEDEEAFVHTYCNTIPTPQGGSHESGLRTGLLRALKAYAELSGNKRAKEVMSEDMLGGATVLLSVFIRDPQFQGQTKEKLASPEASRLVDGAVKDHFDLWLASDPPATAALLDRIVERAEERQRRKLAKDTARKSATRRVRLPGKLTDCSRTSAEGTEIFLVEGDSAGGSAKQARSRETQAVMPLRGKILNVASASADKLAGNQELADLVQALGCGTGRDYREEKLRYERVVIMTDADVDGAHIASLLMTFFFRTMRPMIEEGHLFLAQPPLYRLQGGGKTLYARDDAHKDELIAKVFKNRKVEMSRFKGLGEMMPAQLRETTMDPKTRTMLQVRIEDFLPESPVRTADLVEQLMGRKAEARMRYIQENALSVEHVDV